MRSRFTLLLIAAAAVVTLAVAPGAAAQVAVSGTFVGPHGAVSFDTGVPFVPVHWGHAYRGRAWNGGGYYGRGYRGRSYYGQGYYGQGYHGRGYDAPRPYYRPFVRRRWVSPYYGYYDGYGSYGGYYAPPTVIVRPHDWDDDDCD